ncbi:3757_t:CDS:2 [Diversispora eburnea]|uniref:3757_t:CDS:1 n=1 Tax=Diversispora eburnea TaxID=1213867 RepID=A0A9N8YSD6_9GLOM|nr:3757_t:CDS:2 [Diversispora eburnea]
MPCYNECVEDSINRYIRTRLFRNTESKNRLSSSELEFAEK